MSSLYSVFHPTDRPGLYVIAEAGVNHDGSVPDAHAIIDVAADCGADAVKFQTFDPEALVSAQADAAPYQKTNANVVSQRELLDRYVLPVGAWAELRDHAIERGIDFLSTPFDSASLDLLCGLGVSAIKLGSGDLTNKPLLTAVAGKGLPVICSTGMGTLAEVADAVSWLESAAGLVLMHCVSSYPAPIDQANLRALSTMHDAFSVPIGWSDHTVGAISAIAAVALGACVLEKHVTLDTRRSGPDHSASADPETMAAYVIAVRAAHEALGDGIKRPVPAEHEVRPLVRRSWHVTRGLSSGHRLCPEDLALLRPAVGLSPGEDIVGRRLARDVVRGQALIGDDLRSEPS